MKLLVATDFSPQTRKLLQVARRLGAALSAQVWLVHAMTPAPGVRDYGAGERRDGHEGEADSRNEQRLVREAAASLREAGIAATGLTVEGPPAKEILAQAKALDADMIIVGSHGFGAVFRLLLGSVSEKVLEKAACPVLIVPADRTET
jgi:nucleotide-binding universal stress UspA family protein